MSELKAARAMDGLLRRFRACSQDAARIRVILREFAGRMHGPKSREVEISGVAQTNHSELKGSHQTSPTPGVQASLVLFTPMKTDDEPPSLYHSASKLGAVSTPSLQLSDNGKDIGVGKIQYPLSNRKYSVPTLPAIANDTLISEKQSVNE
ncbi:hypothetical protein GUITHDRAFT_115644 [Guillardia theta CCMP2712]|uniref:Uncharacterized protein n=1 Tax=Guillardia theta (strain CCMP2712) TaxID=905079 RepID=L1IPY5_GUITC|nr:hypothetical protein GUITHDRAFT_115644 [Guillardia theta CCMP2712]EKX38303.1 hypothetical protein GUITHDRAFT_115644 [Guillardia theta CCMP2712]|eukprot:XP_005825283.1 hypothetical protein GUITHDRAFT_115644 [Guillardia theta CCMP2712]